MTMSDMKVMGELKELAAKMAVELRSMHPAAARFSALRAEVRELINRTMPRGGAEALAMRIAKLDVPPVVTPVLELETVMAQASSSVAAALAHGHQAYVSNGGAITPAGKGVDLDGYFSAARDASRAAGVATRAVDRERARGAGAPGRENH